MHLNNLDNYSYVFYENVCNNLKKNSFNPKRILDIGANACETADIMRKCWPKSEILLIEGNDSCESFFKKKNYDYKIKLLGKENGTVNFYKTKWSPVCSGNSIYKEKNVFYDGDMLLIENLPIYKLDDIVEDIYDLIKIDTQGSELDIMLGGINTFSKAKVVICEVALTDINIGGCKKEDIFEILVKNFKFDYVSTIESVLNYDRSKIVYENLLFIKP
jgi:FkbM family methyltransferase